MKRIFSVIILGLISNLVLGQFVFITFEDKGILYATLNNIEVQVIPGGNYEGEVVIPTHVSYLDKTYTVTTINTKSFEETSEMTSITIPKTVNKIDYLLFPYPNNLKKINYNAAFVTNNIYPMFANCTNVTEINIGEEVEFLPDAIFANLSQVEKIIIPEKVTLIGRDAFYGMTNLHTVEFNAFNCEVFGDSFNQCPNFSTLIIGDKVTQIPDRAFNGCFEISSFTIPKSVIKVGNEAFHNTSWFANQSDGIVYKDDVLYCVKGEMLSEPELSIAQGTRVIANRALSGQYFSKVNFPLSLKSIGNAAFYSCRTLTSIVIPDSIIFIGGTAFNDCRSLDTVYYQANACKSMGRFDNPVYDRFLQSVIFSENVNEIPPYAFYGCTGLESISIPESVITIGNYSFSSCRGLQNIVLPDSIKTIPEGAFLGCDGIQSVKLPSFLTSIGTNAFSSCGSLIKIDLPSTVTSIGYGGFFFCTALAEIVCNAENPPTLGDNVFYMVDKLNCVLYVPEGTVDLYKSSDQWNDFTNIVEIGSTQSSTGILVDNDFSIKIFPNPTTSILSVELKQVSDLMQLKIYNTQGLILHKLSIADRRFELDVSLYCKGLYILQITDFEGGLMYQSRFIKN